MKLMRDMSVFVIACFFALMWGLLLREHLENPKVAAVTPRYDRLLLPGESRRESKLGVHLGSLRLGQTRTIIERMPDGIMYVTNYTRLQAMGLAKFVLPLDETLDIDFYAQISPLRGLRTVRVGSQALHLNIVGIVEEGEMAVKGTVGNDKMETKFPFQGFVGEMFSPMAGLPKLDRSMVGQSWRYQVVDPIMGRVDHVKVRLQAYRDIPVEGKKVRVFMLLFRMGSKSWHAWAQADGEVLIQGTPFLVYLVREDVPEALIKPLLRDVPRAQTGEEETTAPVQVPGR